MYTYNHWTVQTGRDDSVVVVFVLFCFSFDFKTISIDTCLFISITLESYILHVAIALKFNCALHAKCVCYFYIIFPPFDPRCMMVFRRKLGNIIVQNFWTTVLSSTLWKPNICYRFEHSIEHSISYSAMARQNTHTKGNIGTFGHFVQKTPTLNNAN